MSSQLERLARPFPARLIHSNPSGGGSYVKHSVVTEKLLAVLGPFSFELVQIIRGHVDGIPPNPQGKSARAKAGSPALDDSIVGAVCRLRVVVDGVPVAIEEVGDCESPHNWPHDGARLKDATSDSLKRCAMRLGVTLHLWSGEEFSLFDQLQAQNAETVPAVGADASLPVPQTGRATGPVSATSSAASPSLAGLPGEDILPPAPSSPGTFIPPQSTLDTYNARCKALAAAEVNILEARTAAKLPPLSRTVEEWEWIAWGELLTDLEVGVEERARRSA